MPFPLIKYRYTCQNTAADKQQCDPQHEVACIAGLRRFGARLLKKDAESAASYYFAAVAALVATVLAGWLLNAALTPLFYRLMNWPMTTATLLAGVWGSTLLNAVKCAVSVLPVYPLVRITQKTVKKYI